MPANTIYVGRGSKFGNPYVVGGTFRVVGGKGTRYGVFTRKVALMLFEECALDPLLGTIKREDVVKKLRGKNLACWCPLKQPCHADILLKIANE